MARDIVIQYLREIGSEGGKATTEAKKVAARLNGKQGGRPAEVFIYGLLDLDRGRVIYVGSTTNLRERFAGHICATGKIGRRRRGPVQQKEAHSRFPYPIGIVVLAKVRADKANETEKLFFECYKRHGECHLNGDTFKAYFGRTPKFLLDK